MKPRTASEVKPGDLFYGKPVKFVEVRITCEDGTSYTRPHDYVERDLTASAPRTEKPEPVEVVEGWEKLAFFLEQRGAGPSSRILAGIKDAKDMGWVVMSTRATPAPTEEHLTINANQLLVGDVIVGVGVVRAVEPTGNDHVRVWLPGDGMVRYRNDDKIRVERELARITRLAEDRASAPREEERPEPPEAWRVFIYRWRGGEGGPSPVTAGTCANREDAEALALMFNDKGGESEVGYPARVEPVKRLFYTPEAYVTRADGAIDPEKRAWVDDARRRARKLIEEEGHARFREAPTLSPEASA